MPRSLKQFLYALLFIAFFSGAGFLSYRIFLKPAVSCFDKVQNQGEEGVDCGMVCGTICLPSDLKPIEVFGSVSLFRPSPDVVSVLAQLRNANATVGAAHFTYHVTFYDEGGAALRIVSGD